MSVEATFLGRATRDFDAALRPETRACDWRLLTLARRLGRLRPVPDGFVPVTEWELVTAYKNMLREDPPIDTSPVEPLQVPTEQEAVAYYNELLRDV